MWKLLMLLLSPRVDDEDIPDLPDVDTEIEETHDEEPQPDEGDEPESQEDEPEEPRISKAQKAIIETRRRAQDAEERVRRLEADLESARRQPVQTAQPTQEQEIWRQEEDVLRNPEASDWQKYAIRSAREAREAKQASQNAIHRAEDLADKTKFEQLKLVKPKLYEAYSDRVEKQLEDLRAKGVNVPREKLLAIQIGEDMLAGKLKSTSTKPSVAKRGNTPGVRSDVNSSGNRMTDAEKRAKRLENIRI